MHDYYWSRICNIFTWGHIVYCCNIYCIVIHCYKMLFGGARGVMVIVIGKDTTTRVQFLDETDCISHSTNTPGKVMNPIILPPAMGK